MAAILARLQGAAANCNFEVKCLHFERSMSYMEQILVQQLVQALAYSDVQDMILSKAVDKTSALSLTETESAVGAMEVGK